MSDHDIDSKESQKQGFKFVDKRRLDETGEERHPEGDLSFAAKDFENPAQTANVDSDHESSEDLENNPSAGPLTFSIFIQSLGHQALMSMGLIPWPDTGTVRANLDHARETIDLLTILHEKTKGNLTSSEQDFFDSVLYELRVTFLKLLQGGTP